MLIYDADCAFCARSLAAGRRHLTWMPAAIGYQHADLAAFGLTREQVERSIFLARPGAPLRHGAGAIAAILRAQPGVGWRLLGGAISLPPVSYLAAGAYALVARFRHRLPGGGPACRPPAIPPAGRNDLQ